MHEPNLRTYALRCFFGFWAYCELPGRKILRKTPYCRLAAGCFMREPRFCSSTVTRIMDVSIANHIRIRGRNAVNIEILVIPYFFKPILIKKR